MANGKRDWSSLPFVAPSQVLAEVVWLSNEYAASQSASSSLAVAYAHCPYVIMFDEFLRGLADDLQWAAKHLPTPACQARYREERTEPVAVVAQHWLDDPTGRQFFNAEVH